MALIGDTSDLERFQYAGKYILPEKGSYSVTAKSGAVYSEVNGGMTKQQLQFLNQPYYVSVTYIALDQFKIDYINNFLKRNDGQKFVTQLMIESGHIEEYVVQVVGDTDSSMTGFNGSISLTLEVEPSIDACWVDFISEWGLCMDNPCEMFKYVDEGVQALP